MQAGCVNHESSVAEVLFRDAAGGRGIISDTLSDEENKSGGEREKVLLCWKCDAEITKEKYKVSQGGKHLHTFFNPAGIIYEIGCFGRASGCRVYGSASREFSWFAGHGWQIVTCFSCTEHLGWFFSSGEGSFFGLIVNRLREA